MSVGDRVKHDYSQEHGTVARIERAKEYRQYPYLVQWDNGKEDWYKRNVLIVTQKARKSSTMR